MCVRICSFNFFFFPGQGFDCHLFALQHLAASNGHKLHDLYTDEVSSAINHHIISTSTLSSPGLRMGGFAPEVLDGFGIGYCVYERCTRGSVSSYQTHNVEEYVECVHRSLEDIFTVLEGKPLG